MGSLKFWVYFWVIGWDRKEEENRGRDMNSDFDCGNFNVLINLIIEVYGFFFFNFKENVSLFIVI